MVHMIRRNRLGMKERWLKRGCAGILLLIALNCSLVSCALFYKHVPVEAWEDEMTGYASWYGKEYHGRKTSNGEIYDMYGLTAAHRTLPLGCEVKITNLENGKEVHVRVNDRGPFIEGRIVDLSYGSATAIGMVNQGLARVHLTLLKEPSPAGGGGYFLQVGSFIMFENAVQLKNDLERTCSPVFVETFETNDRKFYRVRIGPLKEKDKALGLMAEISKRNLHPYLLRAD